MPVYKSSVSIEATVDDTFAFVSDPRNLARFTGVTSAEPLGGDAVRLTTEAEDGTQVTEEAWFREKPGRRPRVEWGTDGPHNYHGWLEVDREGEVCSVTVEIHTDQGPAGEVDAALDRMLLDLKAAVEGG